LRQLLGQGPKPLTEKARVLAVVSLSYLYYEAFAAAASASASAAVVCAALAHSPTSPASAFLPVPAPPSPEEHLRAALPPAATRLALRASYFRDQLQHDSSVWHSFCRTWLTSRAGDGRWQRPKHGPNPLLALLRLQLDEWLLLFYHTGLWKRLPADGAEAAQATARLTAAAPAASAGGYQPSGPRGAPLACQLQREWHDSCRDWAAHLYAYAVPSTEALELLQQHAPLVEMGAGTGYWAAFLQQAGAAVDAYDMQPPGIQPNEYHGHAAMFADVKPGRPALLRSCNPDATLLLCYPPPDNDMALESAKAFRGQHLAYVGEWQGVTGTPALEAYLLQHFEPMRTVELPCFPNQAAYLFLFRRRATVAEPEPEAALHLGLGPLALLPPASTWSPAAGPVYRCRLCREVVARNSADAAAQASHHLAVLARRGIPVRHPERLCQDIESSPCWVALA
jgi:hypothetical protein